MTTLLLLATMLAPTEGVEFNGRSSHAIVADGAAFDLDTFTLCARVKFQQTSGSQVLLNRGRSGGLFTLYLYNGRIRMLVETTDGSYTHASVEPPDADVWTHYAGTYDGAVIRLFVDGELVAETEAPGRIAVSDAPLLIGALTPGERTLDGLLDDVRVYDRALSQEEIGQLDSVNAGLIAQWTAESLDGEAWKSAATTNGPDARYLADPVFPVRKADGYRGIWYMNQPQDDEYVYKYSGGLGTYCAKHRPQAIYAAEVHKTFFCYGGTDEGNHTLLHMISYYDHATGQVPRPTMLLDKQTTDAHDNPVMSIDDRGHIWIFSSSHGTSRPSYISVSRKPYDIDSFERVAVTNFSYTQPYYFSGRGFLFLHTRYGGGRRLFQMTSPDGREWSEPEMLAHVQQGHYQVSWPCGDRLGTAFNYHPAPKGLNWRTNLYYMETADFGQTWQNAQGDPITLPILAPDNATLVHDYETEGRNVYLKDVAYDADGRPVILYLTSGGYEAGPVNDPRIWQTARWTGDTWDIQGTITSDNNYDMGSLTIEPNGVWRIIAPTQPGPQLGNPGGEIALWTSSDQGRTWTMVRQLTGDSPYNHTYCRKPINAHADFYSIWADGHGRQPSESRLYFCDRDGENVRMLPMKMETEFATPQNVTK